MFKFAEFWDFDLDTPQGQGKMEWVRIQWCLCAICESEWTHSNNGGHVPCLLMRLVDRIDLFTDFFEWLKSYPTLLASSLWWYCSPPGCLCILDNVSPSWLFLGLSWSHNHQLTAHAQDILLLPLSSCLSQSIVEGLYIFMRHFCGVYRGCKCKFRGISIFIWFNWILAWFILEYQIINK